MVLTARKIARLLESSKFEAAYTVASEQTKAVLESLVVTLQYDKLILEVTKTLRGTTQLDQLSYSQLREVAKNESVYRYSRLSKTQLVEELKIVLGTTKKHNS